MKKTELLEYGIPEEKIPAFHVAYWADVKKTAVRMVEEGKGQEAVPAPSPASVRDAIHAMLRLIDDPARLALILSNVNRHYQLYQNGETENAQKRPEKAQKGAS